MLRCQDGVVNHAVHAAEQEHSGEMRILDVPRLRGVAGAQQCAEMINHDVVHEALPGRLARFMEQHVVQRDAVEIGDDTGAGPAGETAFEVVRAQLGQRLGDAGEMIMGETLAQRHQHVLLGREVEIERALGDAGARRDLFDGGVDDAVGEKQLLRRGHQVVEPFLRRPRARFWCRLHAFRGSRGRVGTRGHSSRST